MLADKTLNLRGAEMVKSEVLKWIRQHNPKPGTRFMSQRELAARLQVDPMTAHKALAELTQQGILYRVRGRGSFIGHFPHSTSSINLALVLSKPNLQNPHENINHWHIVQNTLTGVMRNLDDHDTFSTVIIPPDGSLNLAQDKLLHYDAAFFIGDEEYSDLINAMMKSRQVAPVIIDSRRALDSDFGIRLSLALNESVYRGVTYMAGSGYRRIAYIGSDLSQEKFEGYKRALADYALPLDEQNIVMGMDEQDSGARGASILFGRGLNCDSIFVDTDFKAVGVIDYLAKQGVKVPDDIGVMGFDGMESCVNAPPYLTTVKTCFGKLIAGALEFLRESEDNKKLAYSLEIPGDVIPNKTLKTRK